MSANQGSDLQMDGVEAGAGQDMAMPDAMDFQMDAGAPGFGGETLMCPSPPVTVAPFLDGCLGHADTLQLDGLWCMPFPDLVDSPQRHAMYTGPQHAAGRVYVL